MITVVIFFLNKLVNFAKLLFITKQPPRVTWISIPCSSSLFFPLLAIFNYSEILTGSLEVHKSV